MIMTSYNSFDGEPSTGLKLLFTEILRNEWGFAGLIMTDWGTNSKIGREFYTHQINL